jgi:hypothetical protein
MTNRPLNFFPAGDPISTLANQRARAAAVERQRGISFPSGDVSLVANQSAGAKRRAGFYVRSSGRHARTVSPSVSNTGVRTPHAAGRLTIFAQSRA